MSKDTQGAAKKEASRTRNRQTGSREQCEEGTEREQRGMQRNREGAASHAKKEQRGSNEECKGTERLEPREEGTEREQ